MLEASARQISKLYIHADSRLPQWNKIEQNMIVTYLDINAPKFYDESSLTLHIHTLPVPTPMPIIFLDTAKQTGRYSERLAEVPYGHTTTQPQV
jgi:hypothetical protein